MGRENKKGNERQLGLYKGPPRLEEVLNLYNKSFLTRAKTIEGNFCYRLTKLSYNLQVQVQTTITSFYLIFCVGIK